MRLPEGYHELLLLGEGVTEVAAVSIRAGIPSKDHAADFSLVARVADHWSKL